MRLLPICLALLMPVAASAKGATLTIDVSNVRNSTGTVHVDICPEKLFLKDGCPFSGDARAVEGMTRVVVTDLPPGRYAAQIFHDENGNGKADQGFLGIPKEGIGFSNDARIRLGPPKFADARFDFAQSATIRITMRYMTGPKGPKAR